VIEERLEGRTIGSADGTFVVAEWVDDGETSRDRPIAPPHLHRSEDEAWYVLEGRLGFRIGDEEVEAGLGGAVLVPAGAPHLLERGLGAGTLPARDGPTHFSAGRDDPRNGSVRSRAVARPIRRARLRVAPLVIR
jgi:hypothetical protein